MGDDLGSSVSIAEINFAAELVRRREAAGLNQTQLAKQLNFARSYLSRGEQPGGMFSAEAATRVDDALGAGGVLVDLHSRAVRERKRRQRRARLNTSPVGGVEQEDLPGEAPLSGQGEFEEDAIIRPRRGAGPYSASYVESMTEYLRDQWHVLVRADNLFGPKYALGRVLNQLAVVDDLLAFSPSAVRPAIIRLGSQYAESASWLYEDAADERKARYWSHRAMEWALECDDRLMLSWTLFRRSQQALGGRDRGQAVGLAKAARRAGGDLPPAMAAAIAQQEAIGHAIEGDEYRTWQLFDEAGRYCVEADSGDARGGHGSFCTAAYLDLQRAGCMLTLGRSARAVKLLEIAVPKISPTYNRDRGVALGRLARAYLSVGEPEHAATTAREALKVAQQCGSLRTMHQVRLVGKHLANRRQVPSVKELVRELSAGEGDR